MSETSQSDRQLGTDQEPSRPSRSPSRSWGRRLRPLIMPTVYVLMTLTVFWRLWTPIDGAKRSWKYDPPNEYWGDMDFQQKTLAEGTLALWNPHDRGGFPIYGDPQPGMFYPPNWPLLLFGAGEGDLPFSATSLKILLHWVFGAIGMHLLIRRFGAKEPAAYVAGTIFAFASPKLRMGGSALNWSFAWIPWVLLSIDYFAERPSAKRGVLMGTTIAMVLLCGAPAMVLYMMILALPFGLYRMWGRLRQEWRAIAAGAGATLLWLMPLMASNLQQLPESVRATRSYDFITHTVFSPGHFHSFMVPRLGDENPYLGACAILGIGLALANRERKGLAWVFLGSAGFAVAMALGNYAGILPATASALSPFSLFRHAHRYLYINSAAVAVLAGLGVDYALTIGDEQTRKRMATILTWVGGALTFALGIAYLVSVVVHKAQNHPKNISFGLGFLSAAVFTVFLRLVMTRRGSSVAAGLAWALPLLVFLDIWTANFPQVEKRQEGPPLTPNDHLVAKLEGVERDYRIYDDGFLNYRPGVRLGIRDFSGYEDDPLGLKRYTMLLNAAKRDLKLMGHANVRYILKGKKGKLKKSPSHKDAKLIQSGMWELEHRAPAVYYVPTPIVTKDAKQSLAKLKSLQPGINAVVEGEVPRGAGHLPTTQGRISRLEPNRLRAEIETPGPGLIVVSEAFYSQWQATLDGKSVEILPANLMFRGIPVDSAGRHVIEMTLSPTRFWALLPAYAGAWLLFLWAAIPWPMRRRRDAA